MQLFYTMRCWAATDGPLQDPSTVSVGFLAGHDDVVVILLVKDGLLGHRRDDSETYMKVLIYRE